MKKILFTLLITMSIYSYGQQWVEHQIDSNVSITIPENFNTVDTLEHSVTTAQIDNGLIIITYFLNKNNKEIQIRDESELKEYYEGFQEGYINSQKGDLINEEMVTINGLKLMKFSFRATLNEERQLRYCSVVFINNCTYTFQFWELESLTNEKTLERDRFFNSLKLDSKLTIKNQISDSKGVVLDYNKLGFIIGKLLGYLLFLTVLVFVIYYVIKKIKKNIQLPYSNKNKLIKST